MSFSNRPLLHSATGPQPVSASSIFASRILLLAMMLLIPFMATATTYPVTTTADSGAGSLREAIDLANANAGADDITFSTTGTLTLVTSLPNITEAVTITGSPGFVIASAVTAFQVTGGASDVTIQNLDMSGCSNFVILVSGGSSNVTIEGNNMANPNGTLAINLSSCSNITIDNNDFTGRCRILNTIPVDGLTITNNNMTNTGHCGSTAIQLNLTTNLLMHSNDFAGVEKLFLLQNFVGLDIDTVAAPGTEIVLKAVDNYSSINSPLVISNSVNVNSQTTISNLKFTTGGGTAIEIGRGDNFTLSNISIDGRPLGVRLAGAQFNTVNDVLIECSTFTNISQNAIRADGNVNTTTIENNSFSCIDGEVVDNNTVNPITAENNFYGYDADPVAADFGGTVDFEPFLSSADACAPDGTASCPAELTPPPASALNFDGTGDHVAVPSSASLNSYATTGELTLEFWVRPTAAAQSIYTIISKGNASNNQGFVIEHYSGELHTWIRYGGSWIQAPVTLTQDEWQHVAIVANATSGTETYVNGVLESSTSASGAFSASTQAMRIGADSRPASPVRFFGGDMDEVRIWDRALCAAEIVAQKDCELSGTESGLVAYYDFNQGNVGADNSAETSLPDISANGHDGTLTNFTDLAAGGSTSNWVAPGGVITGTTCGPADLPEITVNDATAITDFGTVNVGATADLIYTITNDGTADLDISGISIDNGLFTVPATATMIAPGASLDFTVTYSPTAVSVNSGTVSIQSNDCDEDPYSFVVTGEGVVPTPATALDFDGADDYIRSNDRISLFGSQPTTVEFWMNADVITSRKSPIGIGTNRYYFFQPGTWSFWGENTFGQRSFGEALATDTWIHVAITYDGVNKLSLYLDGQPAATPTHTVSIAGINDYIYVGHRGDLGIASIYYDGGVDEVRVWTQERSAAEILANYDKELAVMPPCLALYYKLNQGFVDADNTGETTADDTATNLINNGTLTGLALTGSTSNWTEGAGITAVNSVYDPFSEIAITGNGQAIADGDNTATTADDTDFGTVLVGQTSSATFTIENSGTGDLDLTAYSSDQPQFTFAAGSPTVIGPGQTADYTVIFTPTNETPVNGTITIANNDCDEDPYSFAVTGTGLECDATITSIDIDSNCPTSITVNATCSTCTGNLAYDVTGQQQQINDGFFDELAPGTYTVTVSDTNDPGCSTTSSVTVTADTEAPTVNCGADIPANTDAGTCEAVVNWTTLGQITFADNCGINGGTVDFGLGAGPEAVTDPNASIGGTYPLGSTPVTYEIVDAAGLMASCSFNVIVSDSEAPVAGCQDITVAIGASGSYVLTAAEIQSGSTDNCDNDLDYTIGETVFFCGAFGTPQDVVLTATDDALNAGQCTATVTVTDGAAPTIVCPAAVSITPDAGFCNASNPDLGSPTVSDNCAVIVPTNDAPAVFNAETTTVTWTADDGTNAVATCTQVVTLVTQDNDLDGVCDSGDLDDDNDGILDTDECGNILINGSMEDYTSCPNLSSAGTINNAIGWTTSHPTGGQLMVVDDNCSSNRPASGWSATTGLSGGSDGNNWLGGHNGEDAQVVLDYALVSGGNYTLSFDAGYVVQPPFTQPGALTLYGVAVGATDYSTANLLGTSGDINNQLSNTNENWQTYSFSFTATADIDRILFLADYNSGGGSGHQTYMYFDNLVLSGDNFSAACDNEDTDGDLMPNYQDTDSDGDNCFDVVEAGYSDPDEDGILGTSPVTVDAQGLVVGEGGYNGTMPGVVDDSNTLACCDITLDDVVATDEVCPGAEDGTITVTATCSTCSSIEYSIGGAFQASNVFADVAPGTYTVTIQDSDDAGCNATASVTIAAGVDSEAPVFPTADSAPILLLDENYESPIVTPGITGSWNDLDVRSITTLYGPEYQQVFTVETILVNGPNNAYTDPTGQAGNYSIGILGAVQDDKLSYSFDTQNKDFLNVQLDLSPVDLSSGGNPFFGLSGLNAPVLHLRMYDSPAGVFDINNPGTLLDQADLTGLPPVDALTFNWKTVMAGLDASGSSDGNVTLVFDLSASGYGSFDNLYIEAGNTSITNILPEDLTIQCLSDLPTVPTLSAIDNCDTDVDVTFTESFINNGINNQVITRTWVATDDAGLSTTYVQTITIEDNEAPAIPTLAEITGECEATATAPTTTDNCAGTITGTTNDALTYTAQGPHTIEWTFNDGNGNEIMVNQTVIVEDVTPPTAVCISNLTVNLDATQMASVDAAAINNGSSDNCGTANVSISGQIAYDCDAVGQTYEVTLTVDDGNATSSNSTCTTMVTVGDADGNCCDAAIGDVTTTDEDCPGAQDGTITVTATCTTCTSIEYSIGGAFQASNVFNDVAPGTYTVTIQDSDDAGCNATQSVTVAAGIDSEAPTITCPDPIVTVNSPGECTAVLNIMAPEVSDNCSSLTLGNGLNFDGVNDIAFIAASSPINTTTQTRRTAEVYFRVNDKNINSRKQVVWEEGGTSNGLNIYVFDGRLYIGIYSFSLGISGSWVSTDLIESGQWHNAVLVFDGSLPDAERLKGYLDGNLIGSAATGGTALRAHPGQNAVGAAFNVALFHDGVSSNDNSHFFGGDIDEIRLWTVARTPAELAATNTVQLMGNEPGLALYYPMDQGTACGDNSGISMLEDATGTLNGTLSGFTLNGSLGCTSNFTFGSPALNSELELTNSITGTASASSSYPVGVTNVIWTVTDAADNPASCTQTITITDNEAPTANCATDFTVNLDAAQMASVDAAAINDGSSDNCGTANVSISGQIAYDCDDVGQTYEVTLTVDDGNATSANSTCSTMVTVGDADGNCCDAAIGDVTATNEVCPGAEDGTITVTATCTTCTSIEYSIGGAFQASNVFNDVAPGTYTVTIQDIDDAGCNATQSVTVAAGVDSEAPTASCQDITVYLDANGMVSINPEDIDGGSTDNCTSVTLTADMLEFSCADIGQATDITDYTQSRVNRNNFFGSYGIAQPFSPINSGTLNKITLLGPGSNDTYVVEIRAGNDPINGTLLTTGSFTQPTDNGTVTFANPANVIAGEPYVFVVHRNGNGSVNLAWSTFVRTARDQIALTSPTTTGGTENEVSFQLIIGQLEGVAVELTATDDNNLSSACTATVVVLDSIAPVASTLADLVDECEVTLTPPTIMDNCGPVTGTTTDPLSYTDQGTYTITWTFDDGNGNVITADQNVIVEDVTDPTITCPADMTINVDPGECFATLLYTEPVGADNCAGAITTLISGLGSGGTPPVGTDNVTYEVVDIAGRNAQCTFFVTVVDNEAPTVPVLADVTGECEATATAPTTTDNCTGTITGTTTDPLTYTDQGIHTIEWTFDDGNGNVITVNQTVIVEDNLAPIITCADDISTNNDDGDCSAYVTVPAPVITDNCFDNTAPAGTQADPFTSLAQAGSVIGAGTFFFDVDGNQFSTFVECGWVMIVSSPSSATTDLTRTTALVPQQNTLLPASVYADASIQKVRINATGGAGVPFDVESDNPGTLANLRNDISLHNGLTGGINEWTGVGAFRMVTACQNFGVGPLSSKIYQACSNGAGLHWMPSINSSGQWVTADFANGTSDLNIWVQAAAPVITLTNDITGTCDASGIYPVGTTTITWTATDAAGNSNTCTQDVTVTDAEAPAITCPADVTVVATSASGAVATYVAPVGTDNCPGASTALTAGLASGSTFPLGTTPVEFTVTDAANQTTSCTFNVTVSGTAPMINCPANIVVDADAGDCETTVDFIATETAGIPASTISYSIAPGSVFSVGAAVDVTATATNAVGTDACTFTVTVEDNEDPATPVLADVTGECEATATAPTTTDNCAGTITGTTSNPLTYTAQGTHTIEWTFDDGNGNVIMVNQNVIVDDVTDPATPTLADVTGECSATATAPTTTDNCAGTITGTTSDPLTYTAQGTHTIVWTFDDGNGNVITVNQTVIVDDVTDPATPVLADLTGECVVTAIPPATTDNCAGTITATTNGPTTFTSVGTETITWTFDDGNGNVVTATQNVTVTDSEPPTITCPTNITVSTNSNSCDATVNYPLATAIDNCSVEAFNFFNGGEPNDFGSGEDYLEMLSNGTWNDLPNSSGRRGIVEFNVLTTATFAGYTSLGQFGGHTYYYANANTPWLTARANAQAIGGDLASMNSQEENDFINDQNVRGWVGGFHDQTAPDFVEPGNSSQNFGGWRWTDGTRLGSGQIDIVVTAGPASGSTFVLGDTDVTYTATDEAGLSSMCTFTITVEDNTNPVVPSLANVTGECEATATAPTTTDNCAGTITGTTSDPLTYSTQGTHTIVWTFDDGNDNVISVNQTVIVNDVTAPVVTCPDPITVDNDADACGAVVTYTASATDNCTSAPALSYSIASGTEFAVGTTPVTVTADDLNGQQVSCTFNVTVIDAQDPVAACNDITIELVDRNTISLTQANIDAIALGTDDNCPGVTYALTAGTTDYDCDDRDAQFVVTITATDAANRTNTCTATVTISDPNSVCNDPPVAVCNTVTVDADANCMGAAAGAEFGLNSTDPDGDDLTFSVSPEGLYPLGTTPVTLTVSDGEYAVTCTTTITVVDNTAPTAICVENIIVSLAADGTASITTDNIDAGSFDNCGIQSLALDVDSFDCDDVGDNTVELTVTDNAGLINVCMTTVTVEDNVAPVADCQDITVQLDASGMASITEDAVNGNSTDACGGLVFETDINDFTCANVGSNTVELTVTDANNNSSTCTATVTVEDLVAPVADCQDIVVQLDDSGMASITEDAVNGNSTDACGGLTFETNINSFVCDNVGNLTVELTVTDANNNSSTCTATVTVEDNVAPAVECQDITVELDANGGISITPEEVAVGASGGSGAGGTVTLYSGANYTGASITLPIGIHDFPALNATVGNDNTRSVRVDPGITVELWEHNTPYNGQTFTGSHISLTEDTPDLAGLFSGVSSVAVFGPAPVEGPFDACGIASFDLDINSFACENLGDNTVELTVTDNNGNASTCTATITVEDNIAPTITGCSEDMTVNAVAGDCSALVGLDVPVIDDNCGTTIEVICTAPGSNIINNELGLFPVGTSTVLCIVTDAAGNADTCSFDITVLDAEDPIITNCPADIVVNNDAGECGASVFYGIITASDNCPGVTLDPISGHMVDGDDFIVGTTDVEFLATDAHGNSSTCTFSVTVNDNEDPTFTCPADVIVSNEESECSSRVDLIAPDVMDNCAGDGVVFSSNSTFLFATAAGASGTFQIGTTSVTATASDIHGNTATCTFNVTVNDDEAPLFPTCPRDPIMVSAAADICGAFVDYDDIIIDDNCSGATITSFSHNVVGDDFNLGTTTVTITGSDAAGNGAVCTFEVTVIDDVAPQAFCIPATVSLDANGQGVLTIDQVLGDANDNCSLSSNAPTLSNNSFSCADIGSQTVTVTVTDVNGNAGSCVADVSVIDEVAPTAICEAVTVSLDASGQGTVTAAELDGGSSDICSAVTLSIPPTSFNCSNVGPNSVVLTVADASGNTANCTSIVTVTDDVAPVAVCAPVSVSLDASGNGSISAIDLDAGSNDACGVATYTASQTAFGCSDVGVVDVTLTVTDNNGNNSSCTTQVTVNDPVAPVLTCQDATIELDGTTGTATLTTADVTDSANDACGIQSLTLDRTAFDCAATTSNNVVTLNAVDNNGNSSSCTATITVVDVTAPTVVCQTTIVELSSDGVAVLTAAAVDGGSTDACGIDNLAISQTDFACSDVGTVAVTLTATDAAGLSSSCTVDVTVIESTNPVAGCKDISIDLDASGNASILAAQINDGSTDACGLAQLSVDIDQFDCDDAGANDVVLTITNSNGNTSTCTAIVTVNDVTAPNAVCQDITRALDPTTGTISIQQWDVNNGSYDACRIVHFNLSKQSFDCSDVGNNVITLILTDANGLTDECTANVMIVDETAPTLFCQDMTVTLSADLGRASITAEDVTFNVTDACGIDGTSIDVSSFDCSDLGQNTVTLTATDVNGNVTNCTATVTVEDNTAPTVVCRDVTITVDTDGNAVLSASQVDGGSFDNCSFDLSLSQTDFGYADYPNTTVTLTATDEAGNASSCVATVKVIVPCHNVDNGGSIGSSETGCGSFDPAPITSLAPASGGGNAPIEYLWLSTTNPNLHVLQWDMVGTGETFDPGTIDETTYYIRCARRLGCQIYEGESNVVSKIVNNQGEACAPGDETVLLSGDAVAYFNNHWVSNAANILGPVDGASALFYDYNDNIRVQLPDELPAGSQVTITWKRRNYGGHSPARMMVYENSNNGNGAFLNDIIYTRVKDFHISSVITLRRDGVNSLWIRNKPGYADFEVDAITYCATSCISEVAYCTPDHASTEYEFINRVKVGGINNWSGDDNGYGDYTNQSTNLSKGRSSSIKLTPGYYGHSYIEYWKVYIDFDQDGEFESHEQVYRGRGRGERRSSIYIPTWARSGETRMRVIMKYGGYGSPCSDRFEGEIEDYTVYLSGDNSFADGNEPASDSKATATTDDTGKDLDVTVITDRSDAELLGLVADMKVYPNPTNGPITVALTGFGEQEVEVTITNQLGQVIIRKTLAPGSQELKLDAVSNQLVPGSYLVLANDGNQRLARQLIVVK